MKRFKKILLYVGGEVTPEPAMERAVALARTNGARLTLADVLPESPGPWLTVPGQPDVESMLVATRRDELEEMAAAVGEGIEVTTRVFTGSPFVELIREVLRNDHDLVMKTAQGFGGPLGGILGSTALHLMRKCPCPVWVVRPAREEPRGGVLAAIDPDPSDPGALALSQFVLELGSSLARLRDTELHVLHAWWLWSEARLRGRRMNMASDAVDKMVEETREASEAAVARILETVDLTDVKHRVHVVRGTPFEVVSTYAEQVDVAVMGTLSRTGLAGVLIGNTAERVLQRIDCSVLAVKPRGFETPIQLPTERPEAGAWSR